MYRQKIAVWILAVSLALVFFISMNNSCFCEGVEIWDNDTSSWITTLANGDPIDLGTGSAVYSLQIAVDSSGIVYIVFCQNDGATQRVYLSRYDGADVRIWDNDTSGWITNFANGDPIDPGIQSSGDAQIAVDLNDVVYIIYQQGDGSYSRIYLNRYDGTDVRIWDNNTSSWITNFADGDGIDAATGSNSTNPQIAIDSTGKVYVSYNQYDGSYWRIYLSRYNGTDAEIWDNDLSVWTDTFTDGDPIDAATGFAAAFNQIAVDSTGKVYVTYYQHDGSHWRIYLSRYNATDAEIWDNDLSVWTDTFTDGDPIDAATGSDAGSPQLAVDFNDIVYVVFGQGGIYLSRYNGTDVEIWDNGASGWTDIFTDGDPIDAATGNSAVNPHIAVDLNNRVYVAYQQSDGSLSRIYLSRYDGTDVGIWDSGALSWTDTFADGDPIDPGTQDCGEAEIAIDFNNNVYVTYSHAELDSTYLNLYDGIDVNIWGGSSSGWISNFANGVSIDPGELYTGGAQIGIDPNNIVYVTYLYGNIFAPQKSIGIYYRVYLDRYVPEVSSDDGGGGGGGSSCFLESILGIARANDKDDKVIVLKRFRDKDLLTNPVGQVFVSVYYGISPAMVELINNYPALKSIAREILKPVIWLCEKIIGGV